MKKPKTKEAKLKLADSTLSISEKLFLAPYISVLSFFIDSNEVLPIISPILLSFAILAIAVKFKIDALKLFDEVYEENIKI